LPPVPQIVCLSVNWTKKHIALVAVLACGGLAVGIDQFVLQPGAAPAPAPSDLLAPTGVPDVASTAHPKKAKAHAVPALVARLNKLEQSLALPALPEHADAFVVPAAWPVHPQVTMTELADATTEAPAKPSVPVPDFRLSLIKRSAGVPVAAVINNSLVKVGGSVQGYTLVTLTGSIGKAGSRPTAVLDGPAGRLEVVLEQPGSTLAQAE
jgi:hypothetical protein